MAYLARIEQQTAQPLAFLPKVVRTAPPAVPAPEFSALEWSVIRLARVDGLSTLREAGPVSRFINWLMGRNGSPELANPRLEALRRIAVLSWHFGFTVPGDDVADFLSEASAPNNMSCWCTALARPSPPVRKGSTNEYDHVHVAGRTAKPSRCALNLTNARCGNAPRSSADPLAVLAAAVTFWNSEPSPAAAPPMPMVTVAAPIEREINQWDDYVGRFEASRSVEVRPRVSGQIVGVHFTDGQIVRQGQLLFTIDPRPFAAALAEARAGIATAQSELALAETNLGRARRLLEAEAVSQSDVDRLTAAARSAHAALAAAQARVRSRALDVEFTQVRAPIGGRISDRRIDAGNLVSAGDSGGTLLTTINALDPIYFTFDVPESLYLKTARDRQAKGNAGQTAEVRLQDEADYSWRGRLDFTDNGLNQTSGTVRARAVIANPAYFLAPGMFGNMRLADGGTTRALLIPDAAVRTDQARKIVLVVGRDDTVAAKPVEPGPLVGNLRAIRAGLAKTDRVIIQGVQFAMPGAKVKPRVTQITFNAAPAKAAQATAPSASQATLAN